jgi:hypothetical protein
VEGGRKGEEALCAERTAGTFCRSRSAVRSAVAAQCTVRYILLYSIQCSAHCCVGGRD